MRERPTARVLLLDPEGRILLMKWRTPNGARGPFCWLTVGGGVEPGETLHEAAAREIVEETGLRDARLGPIVWHGEWMMRGPEQGPVHFKESYLVAFTDGGELSRGGWQPWEHEWVEDLRWWTLAELIGAPEAVYPEGLAERLPEILSGRFPLEPLVIRTLDGPIAPLPQAG